MISGYFDSNGQPTIHGIVVIPELDIWDGVDFLVDTDADMTCLHSADIEQLGIDLSLLRDVGRPTTVRGVGGVQENLVSEARVAFLDEPDFDRLVVFTVNLHISTSGKEHAYTLSLLGRDVLDRTMMIYNPPGQRLELHNERSP